VINLKTAKALIAEATIIIEHLGLHHPGPVRLTPTVFWTLMLISVAAVPLALVLHTIKLGAPAAH
jgi:hypothetical protein